MQQKKRASLKDVAKLAGVNFTLVSKYLNHNPQARMSEDTRKRINDAIRELNYRPSSTARSLRYGHTSTIGLISSNLTNPYNAHVVDLVLRLTRERGYQLLIALNDLGKGDAELIRTLFANDVDGILLGGEIVLTGRPDCPAGIYDGASQGISQIFPELDKPLTEALESNPGTIGGLFFQKNWKDALMRTARQLKRKVNCLQCPMPLPKRIKAIHDFLEKNRPDVIVTSGWHTLDILTRNILPVMPGYVPRIIGYANCTGPFFDTPFLSGLIYSSTTELIKSSCDILISQIANNDTSAISKTIPARYISAESDEFRKFITQDFQIT